MKVTISDFILAFFDLLEAEARAFRNSFAEMVETEYENFQKTVFKSSLAILSVAIAGVLFFISAIAFSVGIFLLLNKYFDTIVSLFMLGFIFLILGFVLLLILKKKNE